MIDVVTACLAPPNRGSLDPSCRDRSFLGPNLGGTSSLGPSSLRRHLDHCRSRHCGGEIGRALAGAPAPVVAARPVAALSWHNRDSPGHPQLRRPTQRMQSPSPEHVYPFQPPQNTGPATLNSRRATLIPWSAKRPRGRPLWRLSAPESLPRGPSHNPDDDPTAPDC